jgi:hypothetical protein
MRALKYLRAALLFTAFALFASVSWALTSAQLTTLRAAIVADPVLNALPNDSDGAFAIATAFNLLASPAFTVWRTNVGIGEVGDNINATELAGLSSLNATRLQTIAQYSPNGVNPSLTDRRQFFDDIFSGAGGTITRGKLLILWKRLATRAEKLFATGTGTDAVPATLSFEGELSYQDVLAARAN